MNENVARATLDSLTDLQFLFLTGKGGVGKSTSAAILGLHAAQRGKRALVVIPQSSHNAPSLFGVELSTEPSRVAPGLSAVKISPDEAMREYCRQVLHSQTLTNALFHPRVAGGFLGGIPGLNDWALLGKSWAWTKSSTYTLPKNQSTYDLVIFDAPASGDGTKMLKVPQVIMDLSPQGRLREDAATCQDLLQDPKRSAVLVVSLAEDFAVVETRENLDFIQKELRLPVGPLFFNRILFPIIKAADRAPLLRARKQLKDGQKAEPDAVSQRALCLIEAGLRYENRATAQQEQLALARSWGQSIIEIPEIAYDLSHLEAIEQLRDGITHPGA